MARLLVSKGVHVYAQAALHLLRRGADARFLLAGFADGGPGAIAAHELERWRAAGLEYLGSLEDVCTALAQASVFVLPSSREGTPRSSLEALAMGRAVITTDVPGCRQTVDHGVNGLLVPPDDPPALAHAMGVLIEDAGVRSAMGKRGLELCRERFDVRLVNRDMLRHLGLARAAAGARPRADRTGTGDFGLRRD